MYQYKGACKCKSISFVVELENMLKDYSPRACDCDFCVSRKIQYVSDSKGTLTINSRSKLIIQRQGSEQAEFLTCMQCQQVVAASIQEPFRYLGALNAQLLNEINLLKPATSVSPKQLTDEEKLSRWQKNWMKIIII